MTLPLPIASYELPAPTASSSKLVNCFVEKAPPDSTKGPFHLRRAPGIKDWITVGAGPIRGAKIMGETLYVVSGAELYSVDQLGNTTLIGAVPGAERVRMATNGFDLVIVRPFDNSAYSSDGATVTQITDPVYTGWNASEVAFIDGYLVFLRPQSAQFFNTQLNSLTFDGLNIATAEGSPDNLVGMLVDHRELFLAGRETCELWYDAGLSPGSPFARSPNGLLQIGCAAAYSPGAQDNSIFWLADDLTIRRLDGVTPRRVSQHGIESLLQRMSTVSDCFSLPYRQEGHEFIAFTFPNAGKTIVYDATTQQWHERESLGYGRWRPNVIVRAYGKQLVGDSESGKLGILDPDTHDEWGEPQRVRVGFQPVYAEGNRAVHTRLEIMLNAGHGATSGQGQNPLATLKVSDDGGETFRSLPTRSLGRLGQYKARVQWWRLGSSRNRVYELEITDPVPLFIVDAQLTGQGVRL